MKQVSQFMTAAGRRIYAIPVQSFPSLITNIFVICDGSRVLLVDCGSGQETANRDLLAGLHEIGVKFGETVTLKDIDQIIITHGHIDHYGGLPFVRQETAAPIGVHILDRRVLTDHENRVLVASRRLERFLIGAGVADVQIKNMMQMYLFSKNIYRSTPVQFLLEEGVATLGDIRILHVPGHCPGQVCLLVDDVMLTADHILSRTTPHQAPETITLNMGLGHYLESLDKIAAVPGVTLGLGNHEDPMPDIYTRIAEIKRAHDTRLNRILEICTSPQSISMISKALFGAVSGYHVLLALEETGAHVEYLYQRGELVATNIDAIERERDPVIEYCAD